MMIGTSDSARIVAAQVQARDLGQHQVQDHEGRRLGAEPLERLAPVRRDGHHEALALQVVADGIGQRPLVLDDQDALAASRTPI